MNHLSHDGIQPFCIEGFCWNIDKHSVVVKVDDEGMLFTGICFSGWYDFTRF